MALNSREVKRKAPYMYNYLDWNLSANDSFLTNAEVTVDNDA